MIPQAICVDEITGVMISIKRSIKTKTFEEIVFGPVSTRPYKIGVAGNNCLVGSLVRWLVMQFSQKRL